MAKSTAGLSDAKSLVPDSFTLAGTVWTVKRVPQWQALGNCIRDEATIVLRDGMPRQVEEVTFLHELMHAVYFTMGIDGDKHDEERLDGVAALLHQFMLTRGK